MRLSLWRRLLAAIRGTKLPFKGVIGRSPKSFRKLFAGRRQPVLGWASVKRKRSVGMEIKESGFHATTASNSRQWSGA